MKETDIFLNQKQINNVSISIQFEQIFLCISLVYSGFNEIFIIIVSSMHICI